MAEKLVDASAIAAVIFNEPDASLVLKRIGTDQLVSTTLIAYEIANVCLTKCRRVPTQASDFRKGLAEFLTLNITIHPVDAGEAFALAERMKLTAYDASYLWLARHLGLELVTLDKQLNAAAKALP